MAPNIDMVVNVRAALRKVLGDQRTLPGEWQDLLELFLATFEKKRTTENMTKAEHWVRAALFDPTFDMTIL